MSGFCLRPELMMESACTGLLTQFRDILVAKNAGSDKNELKALLSHAAVDLIRLRQAARKQVEEVEQCKVETGQSKADVEVSNLQLQNLLYEKNYYTKEIASCRSFRSKYPDEQVGLVDVEKFMETAPETLKEGIQDGHKLQQQRLRHEKQQRLELLKVLEAVKGRKSDQDQIVARKRKYLEDLQTQLGQLRENTLPLRTQLGLPLGGISEWRRAVTAAALLPVPLYVLFHQLAAVREAFDEDVRVTVTGSDKEAEPWSQLVGASVFESTPSEAPVKKRRKTESKPSGVEGSPFSAHPLSVDLAVGGVAGEPLRLHFYYLPGLECVTVAADGAAQQQFLAEIFPDDSGTALPNESPHHSSPDGNLEYDASRPDRPYLWAQHLAGMDFLPELTRTGGLKSQAGNTAIAAGLAVYRKQRRIQAVLARLRSLAAAVTAATAATGVKPKPAGVPAETDVTGTAQVKRIKTWEEIVQSRAQVAEPGKAGVSPLSSPQQKPGAAAQAAPKVHDSDEEEGQLPETG